MLSRDSGDEIEERLLARINLFSFSRKLQVLLIVLSDLWTISLDNINDALGYISSQTEQLIKAILGIVLQYKPFRSIILTSHKDLPNF